LKLNCFPLKLTTVRGERRMACGLGCES
jgi:hypothetical protein